MRYILLGVGLAALFRALCFVVVLIEDALSEAK